MNKLPLPCNESERLAALRALRILDTGSEERFDRITRIAQRLFHVPISLVGLVDAERLWFKSRLGFSLPEIPRDLSFCAYTILDDVPLIVPDARLDPRFSDSPLVRGEPPVRFYAGCPLAARDGSKLGTFCILDHKPRQMDAGDRQALLDLAALAESELNKPAEEALRESEQRYRELVEHSQGLICTHALDGTLLSVNSAVTQMLGYQPQEMVGRNLRDFIPPKVQPFFDVYLERISQAPTDTGLLRLATKDGNERVLMYRNSRHPGAGGIPYVLGHALDITEHKAAERRLSAEHAVTRISAEANTIAEAIPQALRVICEALDWEQGAFWTVDESAQVLRCAGFWRKGSGETSGGPLARFSHKAPRGALIGPTSTLRRVQNGPEGICAADVPRPHAG